MKSRLYKRVCYLGLLVKLRKLINRSLICSPRVTLIQTRSPGSVSHLYPSWVSADIIGSRSKGGKK
jgi:hypothetical protein